MCCLLVLNSVTSTPQWICQPKPRDVVHDVCACLYVNVSSIDMYNTDVGQESAQKFMKQTGDLSELSLAQADR